MPEKCLKAFSSVEGNTVVLAVVQLRLKPVLRQINDLHALLWIHSGK